MVLDSVGLTLKDIEIKYVSYTQMGPALANGALDAALEVAPFGDIAIEQKIGGAAGLIRRITSSSCR